MNSFRLPGVLCGGLLICANHLCAQTGAGNFGQGGVRLVAIEGTLEIIRAGAALGVKTEQTNQVLNPGDRLRTGPNSRVVLRWSDQSVVRLKAGTLVEILPPRVSQDQSGLHILKGLMSFFHRDEPQRIQIVSPGLTAGIKGTEFVVAVESVNNEETTTLYLIDGEVEASNPQGSRTITNMQQAVAAVGKAPVVSSPGFIANNVLQWCFYYPAVLDLRDLPLTGPEELILGQSLAAYRAGDLLTALAKYPAGRPPGSDAERVYYAALLLSVGQVEQTVDLLAALPAAAPAERLPRLAASLRQLIAAVKLDTHAPTPNPQLSTELLASSYYKQSRASSSNSLLVEALDLARRATTNSPDFGFAWARVAELEFSFGQTGRALDALNRSLALSSSNAQALALKGFLLAAQNQTREAARWFNRAITVDPGLGNAWLGRGLCKIRLASSFSPLAPGERVDGEPETRNSKLETSGLEDLLIAAALEPQRSLLRSYLGKAYRTAGDRQRATHELDLARRLDVNDPTPWLYSSLLKHEQNRLNEAVDQLEKSIELNDNRSLYRSRLLLDQDHAVRSASLAAIYRDAGMPELSLREAARAVTYDYPNYSAHLFLANSFDALRDPTRFSLRYETPWFNELLLANLLAPAGVGVLSPNISQQEYTRFFERDRLGLATTTDLRSDGQFREVASQFGSFGPFSYSLDVDWQHNDGVRPNNELSRVEWYSQLKFQLTPKDSVLLLTKFQDYHSGDNFQYFDPKAVTVVTNLTLGPNGITPVVRTNPVFRPKFSFDESQDPTVVAAYHREWSPGIHTLALGGRLINDQQLSDVAVGLPAFRTNSSGDLVALQSSTFDIRYRSQFEIWISELNQIFQVGQNTLVLGGRFQTGQFETRNVLTNDTIFNAFFPPVNQTFTEDFQRWSLYGYDTWAVAPNQLWLTAGVAYDHLKYPQNHRQVPVSAGEESTDRLGPKAALVWSPSAAVTVRSAYTRSLGGVSFDESYRLEPAQLAGFNQSYRTLISESVVGSVSAPRFETIGTALDLKFKTRTYVGLIGEVLGSEVDRSVGVYRGPNTAQPLSPSSTPEKLDYQEYSAGLAINQLLADEWSLGASYKFTRSALERDLPEVPSSLSPDAHRFDRADLHMINFRLFYQHPCGFFAQAEANWYLQENFEQTRNAAGQKVGTDLPGDEFWQLNFWLSYRLRRNRGDISVGLLNATDIDYRLNPLNPYSELPRERVVAARVRLRF